jgi:hypothetical protein
MVYQTERSAQIRVPLTRTNLLVVLEVLPVEVDPFFADDLRDPSRSVVEIVEEHWEDCSTCYVSKDAEAYLLARGDKLDIILISASDSEILRKTIEAIDGKLNGMT